MNDLRKSPSRVWTYAFAAIYLLLLAVAPWADGPIAKWLRGEPIPGDLEKVILLAEVFAHGLGVVAILLVVKTLDPRGWRVIPRLASTAFLAGIAANLGKMLVVRRRPNHLEEIPANFLGSFEGYLAPLTMSWDAAFDYATQSFPSAHTATAFGLAMGLSRLYPRGSRLFFSFAILAGLQRMVVHAHFLSDVLVGAGLGVAVGYLVQRSNSVTEKLWASWEGRGDCAVPETLSDFPQPDTLADEDGGNVQEPRRGIHVGSSFVDTQRRRAG